MKRAHELAYITLTWMVITTTYLLFRNDSLYAEYAGYLSFISEAGLDIFAAILSFLGWRRSGYVGSSLYLPLFIGMICAFVSDAVYTLGLNVFNLPYTEMKFATVFETAFLIFLVCQCLFWGGVLCSNRRVRLSARHRVISLAPFTCLSIFVMGAFLFGVNWKIGHLTEIGWFQSLDTIIESVSFTLVSICLARSLSITISCLGVGYLMILSSDFIIRYNVVTGIVPQMSFFETTWIFGLVIICWGLYVAQKKDVFFLGQVNSLKSQISAWMSALILAFFCGVTFLYVWLSDVRVGGLNDAFDQCIFMIVPFMMVVVLLSSGVSSIISSHLTKLEGMIRCFNNNPDQFRRDEMLSSGGGYVHEFAAIESFMGESFDIHRRNMSIQVELNNITSQVAHDIRSPLMTLQLLMGSGKPISSGQVSMIDACLKQIHCIADDLLNGRRGILNRLNKDNTRFVSEFNWIEDLTLLVEQKRVEHYAKMVEINIKIDDNLNGVEFCFNWTDFKRIMSNLINNAVEAIPGVGCVCITCSYLERFINIEISDNGTGFSPDVLDSLNGSIRSTKSRGNALGLSHTIAIIKSWGGEYAIKSTLGKGSVFKILIPASKALG